MLGPANLYFDTSLITILFTWIVLGAICFGMSVLPRWQDKERAHAAKRTPVIDLRKVA